jgi:amino acid adenylation domain-containing protein
MGLPDTPPQDADAAKDADVFVMPASFAQERQWVLEELEPARPTYNVPLNFHLQGALDVDALAAAFTSLVERHETLRTVFDAPEGRTVQVILPPFAVALPVVDLRALASAERESAVARQIMVEGNRPFDLRTGPLLRASLLRLADDEHLLLLTIHHIAVDGWSLGVLQRELGSMYTAFAAGHEPQLAPLPIQYADFAAWQHAQLEDGALAEQLEYWRTQLATPLPALELPTDYPRLATRTRNAAAVQLAVPADVTEAILSLGRSAEVTPFVTLLTAFQLLLHRYTDQHDIIVGSPVAGRTRRETEGLIGLFVNTLALRTRFERGQPLSFRQLLSRVKDTVHSALARQDMPFERIVEAVQPERDRTRTPIFQALFALQDFSSGATLTLGDLKAGRVAGARASAKLDLQLIMNQRQDGFRGTLEYDESLYTGATAERMMAHFGALLGEIAAAPDQDVSRLSLLSAKERSLVVRGWNRTSKDFQRSAVLHELLAEQASRTPSAIALQFGDATLTYRELDERADLLARALASRGVRPGVFVGVCMERSLEMVVALVGILKSGGAYVPMDPDYPADRLAFMLADARCPVLLTQRHVAESRLAALGAEHGGTGAVICLDSDWASVVKEAQGARILEHAGPDDLAYLIYTSGSTGQPKGAMNRHRGVTNRLLWMQDEFKLDATDVVLQKTPFSFDVSIWEFFNPLIAGARLVIAAPGGHRDPAYVADVVRERGVTMIHFVPSMLSAFLDRADVGTIATLRDVTCSGEALPYELQERFFARFQNTRLHNLYGPTEAAVEVSAWECVRGDPRHVVPIGRPIANTQLYVLDAAMAPVPVGIAGELFIGGIQVGVGYHNRPDLTSEKFVADPFSEVAGARLYRTGDSVRWLEDGAIEYLGRLDFQVKLRGFRIELGEIEAALDACDGVRDSAVVLRTDGGGESRLVAYYVASGEERPTSAQLRAWLEQTLPAHMIPSAFVALDVMPLSPSGKLDRRALPTPTLEALDGARRHVPARTMVEHQLSSIWQSLLEHRPIGVQDDFFELGGHSLLALRMLADIERQTGRRLPLASLFDGATIEQLATRIEGAIYDEAEPPVVVLQADGTATPFVMLHGDARGGGWYCRRLAPLLGADVPLIVLPTLRPGIESDPQTIEAMAAHHIRTLRTVQSTGPYRIGGFCAGGMIAFEMARQLEAVGERVEPLILIDAVAGNARFAHLVPLIDIASRAPTQARRLERRAHLLSRLRYYSGRLRTMRRQGMREQLQWAVRNLERRLTGRHDSTALPTLAEGLSRRTDETFEARPGTDLLLFQGRAAGAYIPTAYGGAVDLIVTVEPTGLMSKEMSDALGAGSPNPDLLVGRRGWERVSPTVRVHPMATSHLGLITDGLPLLAERLRACLRTDDVSP